MAEKYKNVLRGLGLFFGGFVVIAMATIMPEDWKVIYYSLGASITFMGASIIGFLMNVNLS